MSKEKQNGRYKIYDVDFAFDELCSIIKGFFSVIHRLGRSEMQIIFLSLVACIFSLISMLHVAYVFSRWR